MRKLAIILMLGMSMTMWSMPARRGGHMVALNNGKKMTIYQHGDEHFHWLTNADGEWVERDSSGNFQVVEPLSAEAIAQRRLSSRYRRSPQAQQTTGISRNIAKRGIIILVNFTDKSFSTSRAEMDSMLIGTNYTRNYSYQYDEEDYNVTSKGSAKKYFHDVSFGAYDPEFDIVGPVKVSHNISYYGKNVGYGDNAYDQRPEEMIVEACKLANDEGVDFTKYDNDGDGTVDFVYVIYAGYGEADGGDENTIWPHSWTLDEAEKSLTLDGKKINLYACGSELSYYSKKHDGIGTFCHEFSHVLGLPDLYETTYETGVKTLGAWDIMDYGAYNNDGNNPPYYSAYECFFMGWLTPTILSADSQKVELTSLHQSHNALLISASGTHNLNGINPNPTTFWLLENRQQENWDQYLPGHGMLVTKIQYSASKWEENEVNNTKNALGVDLIEADGKTPTYNEYNRDNGFDGKAGDAYPKGSNKCSKISGYNITDIKETDGTITFNLNTGTGGGPTGKDCDDYSYTLTSTPQYGSTQWDDWTWDISANQQGYLGYEDNRGAQFGSKSSAVGELSITTDETSQCLIDDITINAAMGSKGDSKLSIFIGGNQVGNTQSLSSSARDYTFTNTSQYKGSLEIRITNSSKAAFVKDINVTFSTQTGLEKTLTPDTKTGKVILQDGRIIIERDNIRYDLLGNIVH